MAVGPFLAYDFFAVSGLRWEDVNVGPGLTSLNSLPVWFLRHCHVFGVLHAFGCSGV